jgi:hypothetical protein
VVVSDNGIGVGMNVREAVLGDAYWPRGIVRLVLMVATPEIICAVNTIIERRPLMT